MSVEGFKERLQEVIHRLRIEDQDFAKAGGISKATLSGYFGSDRQPKQETIANWIVKYNIDANWLMLGVGDMFRGVETVSNLRLPNITKKLMDVEKSMDKAAQLAKLEAMKAVIEGEILAEKNMQPIDGDDRAATG
ncbi:helix-turn-helix transcriptional regulator [Desulfovibrio sp. JC010]|uniref:helix-turn-helix domain-containing protein n=1 Tax=Desulfovibrio sp. JC010 TaxID=2593641 RepID=UPI0013D3A79A|nr:helix-turn-helix transcriptional regulator [Desulfovibrio sp. JC010]NDV26878.1 helix-turn-helix transcriptional regulator [Desulfovibrio sp. JC010]